MTSARIISETAVFETRVRRQLLSCIADLPDPVAYACRLPDHFAVALLSARNTDRGWLVRPQYAGELRKHGLAEFGGRGLTSFGYSVRKVLVEAAQ